MPKEYVHDPRHVTAAELWRNSDGSPPESNSDPGEPGQIAFDDQFFYVCIAPNTWKRTSLANWGGQP